MQFKLALRLERVFNTFNLLMKMRCTYYTQDHNQYALTYALMLGIRVMVRSLL